MSEMVERVASALAEQQHEPLSDWHREEARAVIKAMREPTVEMLIAAQEDWMCVRAAEERGDFIWRAMIDAALADEVVS